MSPFRAVWGVATQLSAGIPGAGVVALALAETDQNVLAWAEAGIAGYVPDTASVNDLVGLIKQISRGEQACPSRIAGSLLRRIATTRGGRSMPAQPGAAALTQREMQISALLGKGLCNKDIARHLGISLGTTKSHVHNLLGKLRVQRRAEAITRFFPRHHSRIEANIP